MAQVIGNSTFISGSEALTSTVDRTTWAIGIVVTVTGTVTLKLWDDTTIALGAVTAPYFLTGLKVKGYTGTATVLALV
jgi:hypothetical protein